MGTTEGQLTWSPPPELVKTYESAMKEVRGESSVKEGTKAAKLSQKLASEASQPTISDTTMSEEEEGFIHAEVREIMQKNLLQAVQLWDLTQVQKMKMV